MKIQKLTLDPDSLRVQTFAPERLEDARGTAFGYSGQYGPGCPSVCPNCGVTSVENQDSGVYGPACKSDPPNCN